MDIAVEFREIIAALNRAGVDYAVCGGFALAMHGHPRATIDIDVVTTSDQVERIKAIAAGLGYTLTGGLIPLDKGRMWLHRVTKVVGEDFCILDILIPEAGSEPEMEIGIFMGERVPVISRESLIAMKRKAGRGQDLEDIKKLEGRA